MIPTMNENKQQNPTWLWFLLFLYLKSLFLLYNLYGADPAIWPWSLLALLPIVWISSFSLLFRHKDRALFLLLANIVISILFFADILYARAFGHLISVLMVFATGLTGDLGGSITSLIHIPDFLMFLDLPLLILLYLRRRRTYYARRRAGAFVTVFLIASVLMTAYAGWLSETGRMENYKKHPLVMSPLGNHLYDVSRFVYEANYKVTPGDRQAIAAWHAENEQYMAAAEQHEVLGGIFKGKNLIVIQVESLENGLIGLEYEGQEITPNINRLLDRSLYFSQVVEQVKDGNSSDAELLFNASLYPVASGSAFLRFGENTYPAMPGILAESGYTSIAIHGDDKEYWNRDVVFSQMGFDRYIDETQFDEQLLQNGPKVGMGILDEILFEQSLREIRQLPEPFNAFIITITSHMPFTMPPAYEYLDLSRADRTADYLQSIRYVDEAFGSFYRQLEAEGLLKDSVLVLYGDHEGVHKYYPTDLPANDKELPFIVHAPGLEGMTIDNPGGQVDMMPTLLYLLGIEKEAYAATVMGRNLLGPVSGSPILPTSELIHSADDAGHLKEALTLSDLTLRVDYFKSPEDHP